MLHSLSFAWPSFLSPFPSLPHFVQVFLWEDPHTVFSDDELEELNESEAFYLELFDAVGGGLLCRCGGRLRGGSSGRLGVWSGKKKKIYGAKGRVV